MSSPAQMRRPTCRTLARLTARGPGHADRASINKDTELHPLRAGNSKAGLRDEERRAFLFTNVVGAGGEVFDIPVLSADWRLAGDYAAGLGVPVDDIGRVWVRRWRNRSRRCWSRARLARKSS